MVPASPNQNLRAVIARAGCKIGRPHWQVHPPLVYYAMMTHPVAAEDRVHENCSCTPVPGSSQSITIEGCVHALANKSS